MYIHNLSLVITLRELSTEFGSQVNVASSNCVGTAVLTCPPAPRLLIRVITDGILLQLQEILDEWCVTGVGTARRPTSSHSLDVTDDGEQSATDVRSFETSASSDTIHSRHTNVAAVQTSGRHRAHQLKNIIHDDVDLSSSCSDVHRAMADDARRKSLST